MITPIQERVDLATEDLEAAISYVYRIKQLNSSPQTNTYLIQLIKKLQYAIDMLNDGY